MLLRGEILQVTDWQILFLPVGRKVPKWLPSGQVGAFDRKGEPMALAKGEVVLKLPAWLGQREFPK